MLLQNFIITGDTHAREGPYPDDLAIAEQLLMDLVQLAQKNFANTIILNGDVWHIKDVIHSPNVLLMLYRVLYQIKMMGIEVIWIRGNHEIQWRTQPHKTLMHLFSKVCNLVITPKKLERKNFVMWLLPWYPGPTFKKLLKEVTQEALLETRRKVVVAHIGVKEGVVSASNYRIDQEVGTADFCPRLFDYVILGDYHAHQYLADNVLYLGAPIPHTFGDSGIVGPWCLRLTANPELQPLCLPSVYPQYDKYVIEGEHDIILHRYNADNRNLIECPASIAARVESMYPTAKVQPFSDDVAETNHGRLADIAEDDWKSLLQEFSASRGWTDRHMELGMEYAKEATAL